ncbi:MAG: prepilin-type N-terminal cleavage/methylation domain-containing protein [Kiritimatiellae bacterium]|nr:prepilin-type N-terminal cleavage/methylation domain-containing protein [Kiritimatiellia bacterium]
MRRSSWRCTAAFSLVEVMVAVAICAVLGVVMLSSLSGSFRLWERGMAGAAEVSAADAFDISFSRDFASSVAGRTFLGKADRCEMSTLRVSPKGETELVRVRYTVKKDGVLHEVWRGGGEPDPGARPDESDEFATRAFRDFAYAGTNAADAVWSPTWDDETPGFISLECAIGDPPIRRVYAR